jgi:hypothetical protein
LESPCGAANGSNKYPGISRRKMDGRARRKKSLGTKKNSALNGKTCRIALA